MRIGELMTSPATTVWPWVSIPEAGRLLLRRGVTTLGVVDRDGRLLGVVSRSDCLRHLIVRDPQAHLATVERDDTGPPRTVADVMTTDVTALPPDADETDAAVLMLKRGIASIPVVQDGAVVGVVSVTGLLRGAVRGDEQNAVRPPSVAGEDLEAVTSSPPPDERQQPRASAEGRATDRRGLAVLDLDECLHRLRSVGVGRLAFVQAGVPVILPVNHGVDGMNIVFRTTWGSKLDVAQTADNAAFEVDAFDETSRTGWSVLVRGSTSTAYEDVDIRRYEALNVPRWAPADSYPVWVVLRPDEISGREIAASSN